MLCFGSSPDDYFYRHRVDLVDGLVHPVHQVASRCSLAYYNDKYIPYLLPSSARPDLYYSRRQKNPYTMVVHFEGVHQSRSNLHLRRTFAVLHSIPSATLLSCLKTSLRTVGSSWSLRVWANSTVALQIPPLCIHAELSALCR